MNNNNLYRETRGVMTQFLPLTEEHLSQIPNSISFHELADELSHQGLSILNVVHDPSRQLFNTYYADYDRGLYSSIMLSRESFSQVLSSRSPHSMGNWLPNWQIRSGKPTMPSVFHSL